MIPNNENQLLTRDTLFGVKLWVAATNSSDLYVHLHCLENNSPDIFNVFFAAINIRERNFCKPRKTTG